jgi:hypothetical protein
MTPTTPLEHVRRITLYVLLMFAGFVLGWLVLLAKVRSGGDSPALLITEVEIHSLQPRWGLNLLVVPFIAALIAIVRSSHREVGDVLIALAVGAVLAIGMAYFPSAVMGGHVRWPFRSTHFDPSGFMDLSLMYAIGVIAILLIMNRIAARTATTTEHTPTTTS